MAGMRWTSSEAATLCSKVITIPCYTPNSSAWSSGLSTSLATLGVLSLSHCNHCKRCMVAFPLVLICISLMSKDVEHLFTCFEKRAIHMYLGWSVCCASTLPFFIFGFFSYCVLRLLQIVQGQAFYQLCALQIYFPMCGFLKNCLNVFQRAVF